MGSKISSKKQILLLGLDDAGKTTFFYNLFIEDESSKLKELKPTLGSQFKRAQL
jgi:hypothetical protein